MCLVLDMLRLIVLTSPKVVEYTLDGQSILHVIANATGLVNWHSGQSFQPSKVDETNVLLNLRLLANMFELDVTRQLMQKYALDVISGVVDVLEFSKSKLIAIAQASILFNYTVLSLKHLDEEIVIQVVVTIGQALKMVQDEEAAYRLLVGLGNMVSR
jgi:hypothetical protein